MARIAPSILSADFARLGDAIGVIESGGADVVHLDVMDGHFVPNLTIGPAVIRSLRKLTDLPFDAHLMVSNPQQWIPMFLDAGVNMISIHIEADAHLHRGLTMIRDGGAMAGVAINPGTAIESLRDVLPYADYVLLMSVNPGFGGQSFIESSIPRLIRLRQMIEETGSSALIEIDGGIDVNTAPRVVAAGAELLVAGSAIFGKSDPVAAIQTLRDALSHSV